MKPKIWVASEEHGGVKVLEDEDITPVTTRRTAMTTTTIQRIAGATWMIFQGHKMRKELVDEDMTETTTTFQRMTTWTMFEEHEMREELVDEDMTETATSHYVHLTIKGQGDSGILDFEALMMFSLQVLRFPCQEVINSPSLQNGIPLPGLPSKILPNLRRIMLNTSALNMAAIIYSQHPRVFRDTKEPVAIPLLLLR
jgi:hypothetical protein